MEAKWFYKHDGQKHGPVLADRIKELLVTGQLHPGQPIWKRDADDLTYVRADTVVQNEKTMQLD